MVTGDYDLLLDVDGSIANHGDVELLFRQLQ